MEKNKNRNFIEKYEREIKDYREKYYKNILIYGANAKQYPTLSFFLIPIIIAILILLALSFNIIGYIIALISVFVTNYLIKYFSKILNAEPTNEYLEIIRRNGYHSIEEYEEKVKKIITGPTGYYQNLLNELIVKYKIDETTRKIYTTNGEEYYFWVSSHKDKIMLLNTKATKRPEIKIITISNVRYFRIDNARNCVVVNTSSEDYFFKIDAFDQINEVMKEKRLENIKTFTPATYIDDFEIYMHSIKSEENKKNKIKEDKLALYVNTIAIASICLGIIVALAFIIKEYEVLFNVIGVILLSIISTKLRCALSIKITNAKTDNEYIKELNSNPECIERFEELKYVLGIKPTYDSVYTLEGAEYKTWLVNGYFHVFLNLIYFNVVYMSVKLSDVTYYKLEENECIVKLKDKTLSFTKDAEQVFRKILPNKDYYWLKGYQNNKNML